MKIKHGISQTRMENDQRHRKVKRGQMRSTDTSMGPFSSTFQCISMEIDESEEKCHLHTILDT